MTQARPSRLPLTPCTSRILTATTKKFNFIDYAKVFSLIDMSLYGSVPTLAGAEAWALEWPAVACGVAF